MHGPKSVAPAAARNIPSTVLSAALPLLATVEFLRAWLPPLASALVQISPAVRMWSSRLRHAVQHIPLEDYE